jgi:hypothetical protein
MKHYIMKTYGEVDVQMLTSGLVGGDWPASRPSRSTPEKGPPVSLGWEAGWAPEPVWTTWREGKSSPIKT